MFKRLAKNLFRRKPAPLATGSADADDFDWVTYNEAYAKQMLGFEKDHTSKLASGDFQVAEDGSIQLSDQVKPLHPNHRCLYETIGALAARSVIELGCGGGDHLHNIGEIYPQLDRWGYDRSDGQLDFLRARSPHLAGIVQARDMTQPHTADLRQADVVYTQAVIMHIHAGDGHLVAMTNACKMATRAVVLMENWERHDYIADLKALHAEGKIDWPELHFSFRRLDGRPYILIASPQPTGFETLDNLDVLRGA